MLTLLLVACGSSGSLVMPDTEESGVPDSRGVESRLPDSRIADTQKAEDSNAAEAAKTTTYPCAGMGAHTYTTDVELNIGGRPPDFAIWGFYSEEYREYVLETLGQTLPPAYLTWGAAVSDDGRLTLSCQMSAGIEYTDHMILVEW